MTVQLLLLLLLCCCCLFDANLQLLLLLLLGCCCCCCCCCSRSCCCCGIFLASIGESEDEPYEEFVATTIAAAFAAVDNKISEDEQCDELDDISKNNEKGLQTNI